RVVARLPRRRLPAQGPAAVRLQPALATCPGAPARRLGDQTATPPAARRVISASATRALAELLSHEWLPDALVPRAGWAPGSAGQPPQHQQGQVVGGKCLGLEGEDALDHCAAGVDRVAGGAA